MISDMTAALEVHGLEAGYGRHAGAARPRPGRRGRRHRDPRPVRLRQDHAAARGRRVRRRRPPASCSSRAPQVVGGAASGPGPAARPRLRAAGRRALPPPRRRRQHRVRAARGRERRGSRPGRRDARAGRAAGRAWPRATRTSCPAVSSSGSRWPGHSRRGRASSCSTSRSRRWTRRCARTPAAPSCARCGRPVPPPLLVTHDQGEALSLADQVAVMMDGAFLQVGVADDRLPHARRPPGGRVPRPRLAPRRHGRGAAPSARCALGVVPLRTPSEPGRGPARRTRGADPDPAGQRGRRRTARRPRSSTSASTATTPPCGCASTRARSSPARTPATSVPAPGDRVRVGVVGDVVAFRDVGGQPRR